MKPMSPMHSDAAPPSPYGLYIHVPFCVRKCAYCAFYSCVPEPEGIAAWLTGIEQELRELPEGFAPDSVFLGGGTPTALPESTLRTLLQQIHQRVNLDAVTEWTCEVNPGTFRASTATLLRDGGVNRLSIGAQSFRDETLKRLGRIHTAEEVSESVGIARAAGFDNVGLDLIYGVPGVSTVDVQADAEALLHLNPEHLSCYCLEIEEGTPFSDMAHSGHLSVSESDQREQFDGIRRQLSDSGYTHYEISNFARPGFECRQNLLYWNGGEYQGLGPAAHSHWEGVRWGHSPELPEWRRFFEEQLAPEAKACETLVMGLRRLAGWGRGEFCSATGFDYDELRGTEIRHLAAIGKLVVEADRIRLADDALFVSDSVFAELV
jgi:oxygen-independent coproporphyrinogen III oxidase